MKKPIYQQWLDGQYSNPGGFELSLMETYRRGSESNQKKLRSVYPEYFGEELSDEIQFFKTQLEESSQIELDIYEAIKMGHIQILGGDEDYIQYIEGRLKDGENAIDLYIKTIAGGQRGRLDLFFQILNQITK